VESIVVVFISAEIYSRISNGVIEQVYYWCILFYTLNWIIRNTKI